MVNTLYPGSVNSISTTLTAKYTTGDTTLHLDTSHLPAAPNTVTLFESSSDDMAVTFLYTGKSTGQLTGLTVLEGTDKDWPIGTFASRTSTNYDWQAVIDHFGLKQDALVVGIITDVEDGVAVSYAPGALPRALILVPICSGADLYMTFMQYVSLESFSDTQFTANIKTNTGSSGNPMTLIWIAVM